MKKNKKSLAIFEGRKIRRLWDEKKELWYFSVVDVVSILSGSVDPRNYWKVLKSRLKEEGSEVVTKCNQLKFLASDGKYYLSDAADTETMFRLIQSIPSPKAEPFKRWLARPPLLKLRQGKLDQQFHPAYFSVFFHCGARPADNFPQKCDF